MDQNLHTPEVYDFRQYDHLWQRVAPGLEPYPRQEAPSQQAQTGYTPSPSPMQTASPAPAASAVPAAPQASSAASPAPAAEQMTPVQEGQLPGAQPDPCCMGTAAADLLGVLTGFAEEELENQRQLQALSRQAPSWARQRLRELAAEEGENARRLMAVYYLITGECYRPRVGTGRIIPGGWCASLRERYHAAACTGMNYARAAESTTDICLTRLLEELSEESYQQADVLLTMLERSMRV